MERQFILTLTISESERNIQSVMDVKNKHMDNKGEISGYYDLRIGLGTRLSSKEAIARAIRDCFLRNKGKLDKAMMDKTIKAVGKNTPQYITGWKDFKKTFEIKTKDEQYINPFQID